MSTVILPIEGREAFGHFTRMDLAGVLGRVERRLKELKLTARGASVAAGKPDAINNLRRAAKTGSRQGVTTTTLTALAPVLKTSVAWLTTGEGPPGPANVVPVLWTISAGGSIETSAGQFDEPLFEVEIPFQLTQDVIGLLVTGESMWPRYDPQDILVVLRQGDPIASLVGWEAAVMTAEGNRYFKRILPGSRKGLFDLESYNAPTMRNQRLQWVAGLIIRIPAPRWHRRNGVGVKAAVEQAIIEKKFIGP